MPRKARSDTEKQEDRIRAVIRAQQQIYHIKQQEMPELLMVSRTCYMKKLEVPLDPRRGFRLGDVVAMDKVLHFTPEKKAAFMP